MIEKQTWMCVYKFGYTCEGHICMYTNFLIYLVLWWFYRQEKTFITFFLFIVFRHKYTCETKRTCLLIHLNCEIGKVTSPRYVECHTWFWRTQYLTSTCHSRSLFVNWVYVFNETMCLWQLLTFVRTGKFTAPMMSLDEGHIYMRSTIEIIHRSESIWLKNIYIYKAMNNICLKTLLFSHQRWRHSERSRSFISS